MAASTCALYELRQPQATLVYRLAQAHCAACGDGWEKRFEGRYGFWRAAAEKAVGA